MAAGMAALIGIGPGRSAPGVFAAAVTHALWLQVGAFVLAFLLMLALPGRTRSQPDGEFRHSSAETITATRGSAS